MKILIVKTSALGDIVQAFPVISYIKKKFPEATIDWVVEEPFASLVSAHPAIDHTLIMDTKTWRKGFFSSGNQSKMRQFVKRLRQDNYNVIFDLQGNVKSGLVTVLARGKAKVGFSRDSVTEWPNVLCTNKRFSTPKGINVRSAYLHLVQNFFNDFGSVPFVASPAVLKLSALEQQQLIALQEDLKKRSKPLVMVCHGSNWKNKQLTLEALSEFLHLLQVYLDCDYGFAWGNEIEKGEAESFQKKFNASVLLPKMSLPILQHLMADMRLIIAMDSLPLHLAATTSTATFSVFGASLGERYAPSGGQHHFVQGSCPYERSFNKRCPILRSCPTGACIRDLSGKHLFKEFIRRVKV
ncbi:MAG: lipopolysaccharide heptosyltransferase I [Parachlamydiaceae bacterium]|nr:lipopolysaccharide heptosyltransferase I [Parachlamydiaceae bacterium]